MSGRLYNAYPSDSESDTDTGSTATDLTQSSDVTETYLLNIPGTRPPITTGYDVPGAEADPPPNTGTSLEFKAVENTSLFMLNSRDRDTHAYPQPTFFTLRLPRVYKNVKSITLTQINLLNSFFNFTLAKSNTTMYVYEQGRVLADGSSNIVAVTIPDGTYNSTDLVIALNNAMNATPVFASISFTTFLAQFQLNGDFTPLFNTPGPIVYNALTNKYDTNQTINDIVARYFQVLQTLGNASYTYNQSLVAYYYPIMYEMTARSTVVSPFATDVPQAVTSSGGTGNQTLPPGYTTWYDYILFGFQGLDDPYITNMILYLPNITIFDNYHYQNTFNTALVNTYECSYNQNQGRLVISAPSLNISISTDLNNEYTNILNGILLNQYTLTSNSNFVSIDAFNAQYSNIQNSNSVTIAFYNWLQGKFTSNYGINFGQYSAQFFANSNNQLELYNTLNEFGWNLTFTPTVSLTQISSNALAPQVSTLWPNINIPKTFNNPAVSTFVSTIALGVLNFSNAGESQYGYTDVPFTILPTSYIRTTFQSACRQNINMMTIPRYINARGPGTEEVYNFNISTLQPPLLINNQSPGVIRILTDVSGNTNFNMYRIQQNMFHTVDYMRSLNQWLNYIYVEILSGQYVQAGSDQYNKHPPALDINLTSYRPFIFFQVDADNYPISPDAYFDITFYIETQQNLDGTYPNFQAPITITWYKDRAGFMADALNAMPAINPSPENPRNYFQTQTFGTDVSGASMTVTVRNFQQTYFYVHYANTTNGPLTYLRAYSLLTNVYGDYTQATQNDKLDLPYTVSSIYDQFTPASAVYSNNLISIYSTSVTTIGYDVSSISNNLTDYVIVGPNNNFYDPVFPNVNSSFYFNLSNVGAPAPLPNLVPPWSLYFGSNSSNLIQNSVTSNVYLSSLQSFVVSSTFMNETTLATFLDPRDTTTKEIFLSPGQDPYMPINSTTIFQQCVNYDSPLVTDVSTSYSLLDTTGFSGISFFLPPDNVITMEQFVVKFAYTAPTTDANSNLYTRSVSPFLYNPNPTQGVLNSAIYENAASQPSLPPTTIVDIPFAVLQEYPNNTSPYFQIYIDYNAYSTLQTIFNATQTNVDYTYPNNALCVNITELDNNQTYSLPLGIVAFYEPGDPNNIPPYKDYYSVQFFNFYINKPYGVPIFPNAENSPFTIADINFNIQPWDDWYLWNRINTKIGIFPTAQIQGASTATLSLSSALYTMTLTNVTQVCQSVNRLGTLHTREPDWGTFYNYTIQNNSSILWAPAQTNISSFFTQIPVPIDITPTYTAGDTSYPGYTLTTSQIFNYSYLPRSYGIAPSVGNAVNYPYPNTSSYTADIPNSYTAVPFAYNISTQTWQVGSFYGLSFTRTPSPPSTGLVGAAPYYGPPGIFGWHTSTNVFTLYNGEQATFQPYYWLGKVTFNVLPNISYNPATDLAAFGGYAGISGEFQDTFLFFYVNSTIGQDYKDISSGTTKWKWGQESNINYSLFDDQSGYNFLSYIYQASVRSNVPEYATHVRAYDPIPKFNTGLRFIGKNYTDFGTPTLGEIAQEISSLNGYQPISDLSGSLYLRNTPAYNQIISTNNGLRLNNGNAFSHLYADSLINFNRACITSSITFGARNGYTGVAFTFTGYSDALNQYVNYYSTVRGEYTIFTSILSTATTQLNKYIELRYGNILPAVSINRAQFTAPIPFQLLFLYNLKEPYLSQYDEWGLGWYLGFNKQTTPPIPRTRVTSDTFIRIVQDYIYLRLNPSQNINTMGVSAKEDLSQTRESQGMDTQYFSKIILNDFASYCRAGVQLEKNFSPVLGKYEVIECQLTDKNGNTLSNIDCEYDMVVQITEVTNTPTTDSSLVGPKKDLLKPDIRQLGLTSNTLTYSSK